MKHEIIGDGRTVWVNSGDDGCSLARFSRYAIDVHKPSAEQIRTGDQCLACSHRNGDDLTKHDWAKFKALVKEHYDVDISDDVMPSYLARST